MPVKILIGDALERLRELPEQSIHCVVTSPPYWGLRDYHGEPGMIGMEPTFAEHVENLVMFCREIRRVLRDDGVFWLNYGDTHADSRSARAANLKPKQLMMMPARVAIALQDDGWWVRQRNVWHKRNPMPDSARNRPANAHEDVYQLTKSGNPLFWVHPDKGGARCRQPPDYVWEHKETGEIKRVEPEGWRTDRNWKRRNLWRGHDYYYDDVAVRTEPKSNEIVTVNGWASSANYKGQDPSEPIRENPTYTKPGRQYRRRGHVKAHQGFNERWDKMSKAEQQANGASLRNVWSISNPGYKAAHFATFPTALIEPCIQSGTSEKGACPHCGAPWARITTESLPGRVRVEETIDWKPTCTCPKHEPVPCTVLDPFAGAGTTALVAQRLARDSILVEISEKYARMAQGRLEEDAPLIAMVELA